MKYKVKIEYYGCHVDNNKMYCNINMLCSNAVCVCKMTIDCSQVCI